MIPKGATHKIKDAHKDCHFPEFVKIYNYECKYWSESLGEWMSDKGCDAFIGFYDELDSKVETPEEKECLDAIEMRNACNESVAK